MIPFKMINSKKTKYIDEPKIKKKMNPKISFKVLTLNMTPCHPNNVINLSNINYLNNFMPNLTAKVWRTYNASYLFQKEIDKIKLNSNIQHDEKLNYLLSMFNHANIQKLLAIKNYSNLKQNKS